MNISEPFIQRPIATSLLMAAIGFVGLVIPHFARMVVGPDFRRVLPASLSFGACYLLIVDGLCRTMSTAEIPLGILTALVGAVGVFLAAVVEGTLRGLAHREFSSIPALLAGALAGGLLALLAVLPRALPARPPQQVQP